VGRALQALTPEDAEELLGAMADEQQTDDHPQTEKNQVHLGLPYATAGRLASGAGEMRRLEDMPGR